MQKAKRLLSVCVVCLMVCLFSMTAMAAPGDTLVSQYTKTYDDGSYAVISVYQETGKRGGPITGHKDYAYYDGGLAWVFTVHGSFTYNGSSATCTGASYTYSISNNAWSVAHANAYASGNTAYANGTMRRGSDGREIYPSVSISCSANGSLY